MLCYLSDYVTITQTKHVIMSLAVVIITINYFPTNYPSPHNETLPPSMLPTLSILYLRSIPPRQLLHYLLKKCWIKQKQDNKPFFWLKCIPKTSYLLHRKRVVEPCTPKQQTRFRPFLCEMCNRQFVVYSEYRRHLHSHTKSRSYMCTHCGRSYCQKNTLIVHLYQYHNASPNAEEVTPRGEQTQRWESLWLGSTNCPLHHLIYHPVKHSKYHVHSLFPCCSVLPNLMQEMWSVWLCRVHKWGAAGASLCHALPQEEQPTGILCSHHCQHCKGEFLYLPIPFLTSLVSSTQQPVNLTL